jgi:hypothetical protein
MKKDEIEVGGLYAAKVSDRIVKVRIDSSNTRGGWNATNTATGKRIRIKSAQRLRRAVASDPGKHCAKSAGHSSQPEVNPTVEVITGQPISNHRAPRNGKKGRKPDGKDKPKRTSALDAAAEVLKKASNPMRAQEMIAAMGEQGLWTSPNGRTPHATLHAAIIREIRAKGGEARFRKTQRGQFEFNAA